MLDVAATDVSISPTDVVISGVGFLERPDNPGFFNRYFDTPSFGGGMYMEAVPGGVRDVSTSFGPGGRLVFAVAHGGVTDFQVQAPGAEPYWEANEPLGAALGAALDVFGHVVLAGERLDGDEVVGSFVSSWREAPDGDNPRPGILLWSTVDEPADFAPAAIATAIDGSVYVAGTTAGAVDAATLAAYSPEGEILWSRQVESTDGFPVTGTAIAVLPDGQIVGGHRGPGDALQSFLRKFDANGESTWQRDFSADGSSDVVAVVLHDIAAGFDGRIAVAGHVGRESDEDAIFVAVLGLDACGQGDERGDDDALHRFSLPGSARRSHRSRNALFDTARVALSARASKLIA